MDRVTAEDFEADGVSAVEAGDAAAADIHADGVHEAEDGQSRRQVETGKGRNYGGKFGTGNFMARKGPGRPTAEEEKKYRQWFAEEVTEEEWREVVRAAIREAKKGNAPARNWLGVYSMGPPLASPAPREVHHLHEHVIAAIPEAKEAPRTLAPPEDEDVVEGSVSDEGSAEC